MEQARPFKGKRRSDFQKGAPKAYRACQRHPGWLDLVCRDMQDPSSSYLRSVYAIKSTDGSNQIYIGISYDPDGARLRQHRNHGRKSVKKVLGGPHELVLLEENLPVGDALEREKYWIKQFRDDNEWTVLNSSSGGARGGGYRVSNAAIIRAAKRCETLKDFYRHEPAMYQLAVARGLYAELAEDLVRERVSEGFWLIKENHLKPVSQCDSRREYQKKFGAAYKIAHQKKWMDEFFPPDASGTRKPPGYWKKKKNCQATADQCDSRGDFYKKFPAAADTSFKRGWINQFFPIDAQGAKKPNGYWKKKKNIRAIVGECSSRSDMKNKYPNAYQHAYNKGWIDEFFPEKFRNYPNGYWKEKEHCQAAAAKCSSRSEFLKNFSAAGSWSKKFGWMDEFFPLDVPGAIKPNGYWKIKTNCKAAANQCETYSEFRKKFDAAYRWSKKYGWIDEFFPL